MAAVVSSAVYLYLPAALYLFFQIGLHNQPTWPALQQTSPLELYVWVWLFVFVFKLPSQKPNQPDWPASKKKLALDYLNLQA